MLKHQLLPQNHFKARKRRSTVQALMVLTEQLFQAWKHKNLLSLVSFDVKGAYNGVAKPALLRCLRKQRIPEVIVKWVDSFCSNRQAQMIVNGLRQLPQAGLPQGSAI